MGMHEWDAWLDANVQPLANTIRAVLTRMTVDLPPEEVAGLAVYSDGDADTLVAAVNTRTHLAKQIVAMPQEAGTVKWCPQEWDRDEVAYLRAGAPDELGRFTSSAKAAGADVGIDAYRTGVWELAVRALGVLRAEGFFDRFANAIRSFDVSDTDFEPDTWIRWVSAINNPDATADFERWLRD